MTSNRNPTLIDAVPAPASLIIAIGERINAGIDYNKDYYRPLNTDWRQNLDPFWVGKVKTVQIRGPNWVRIGVRNWVLIEKIDFFIDFRHFSLIFVIFIDFRDF